MSYWRDEEDEEFSGVTPESLRAAQEAAWWSSRVARQKTGYAIDLLAPTGLGNYWLSELVAKSDEELAQDPYFLEWWGQDVAEFRRQVTILNGGDKALARVIGKNLVTAFGREYVLLSKAAPPPEARPLTAEETRWWTDNRTRNGAVTWEGEYPLGEGDTLAVRWIGHR